MRILPPRGGVTKGEDATFSRVLAPPRNRGACAVAGASPWAYGGTDRRRRTDMTTILVGTDTSAAADLAVEDAAVWPDPETLSCCSCT